ncbi:MAG: diaminopimelate decarboxylase [Rhodobiaceae bacterium]|jgi:diaminopimelate decarboxylase
MTSSFTRDDSGRLTVGGLVLEDIAAAHGTPLYVYSGDGIRADYRNFAAAVAPVGGKVHFALKANSALGVMALLAAEGAGADIVSGGELHRARAAGVPADMIVFSGVGKTAEEIGAALDAGIGQINAESAAEVEAISRVAAARNVVAPVALRVNVDVAPDTHAKISTGQRSTKFGVSTAQNEAASLYRRLAGDPHIRPAGLAVHIGSQILDLDPFARAYSALLDFGSALRDEGLPVPTLDLGGGIGVDYEAGTATDFTAYGALVSRIFADSGFQLGFEPGRSIVANNGALLTRVIYLKDGDNKRFVIVDAAMNDLLRPTLYEAYHAVLPLGPAKTAKGPAAEGPADIVGPVCETGDYLAQDRMMPALAEGDGLAVMSAGAYGAVMASSYNSRPPAGEVMVLDGTCHVLRRQRDIAELLAEETIPVLS